MRRAFCCWTSGIDGNCLMSILSRRPVVSLRKTPSTEDNTATSKMQWYAMLSVLASGWAPCSFADIPRWRFAWWSCARMYTNDRPYALV